MFARERFWWAFLAFWVLLLGLNLAFGSGTARLLNAVAEVMGIALSVMNIRRTRRSRISEGGDTATG